MATLDHPLLIVVVAHHHGPELVPSLFIDLGQRRHLPSLTSETHHGLLTDRVHPFWSLEAEMLVLQELSFHLWGWSEVCSIGIE